MQTNTYQGLQIINKKQSITTDELVKKLLYKLI